jgi:hypothetical protein
MINKFVDKIFVINLPHRKDRLESFDNYSKIFGFEYEVFEAFDGKKLIDDNFVYDGIKVGGYYVSPNYFKGQVGCLISHLNLLKHCNEMNYSKVMIFEDDCAFHDDFNNRFLNLFSSMSDNWDMIYLSGSLPKFEENYEFYSRVSHILTTHSYLVNSKVYELLISNFLQRIFTDPVDISYSEIHSKINAYVAIPFLTYQKAGYSDIAEKHNDYNSLKTYL